MSPDWKRLPPLCLSRLIISAQISPTTCLTRSICLIHHVTILRSHSLSLHRQNTVYTVLHVKVLIHGTNFPVILKCVPMLICFIPCQKAGKAHHVPAGFVCCASSRIQCMSRVVFWLPNSLSLCPILLWPIIYLFIVYNFIPHPCVIIVGKWLPELMFLVLYTRLQINHIISYLILSL